MHHPAVKERASSKVNWSEVSSAGKAIYKIHPQYKACNSVTISAQASQRVLEKSREAEPDLLTLAES